MKKILLVAMTILLCASLFAAAELKENYTRDILINGFVKSYCITNIRPIMDSSNPLVGMPFDIMGDDIKLKSDLKLGREIARWDIATNLDNVTLTFNITPLTSDSDGTQIAFYLTFRIAYDGPTPSGFGTIVDYYSIPSDSANHVVLVTNRSGEDVLPVISLDQDIRFMLAQDYSSVENSWPYGAYHSTVTLLLEAN